MNRKSSVFHSELHKATPLEATSPSAVEAADPGDLERMLEQLEREESAFAAQLADLVVQHDNEFVAIVDGQVVDSDMDRFSLARRVLPHVFPRTALIKRVTRETETTDVFYTPFEDSDR